MLSANPMPYVSLSSWNISIALSRVGPGVFFALFGTIVVGYALHASVRYLNETSLPAPDGGANVRREIFGGVNPSALPVGKDALAAARLRARAQIEFLNSARQTLRENVDDLQRQRIDRNITAIKLAIMERVWEREVWGDPAAFRDWAEGGAEAPVPPGLQAAAAFYHSGQEGK